MTPMELALQRIKAAGGKLVDGMWEVPVSLDLAYLGLEKLPPLRKVGRDFDCSNNLLTSLEGAPREVGRGFYCSYNQLPSGETYQKWLARRAAPKTATVRNASAQGNFPSQDAFIAQVAAAKDKNEWTSAELSLALASFVYTNDLGGRLLKFLLAYTAEKDEDE